MLMGFRVSELQVLLGFAGRSKSGRKHELMGRALQLLKCEGNYQVRAKIKELYRQRYPRKLASPPPRATSAGRVCIVPQSVPVRGREPPNGIPIHPDVRLISLPFFEYIDDLVRPTSLGKKDYCCNEVFICRVWLKRLKIPPKCQLKTA